MPGIREDVILPAMRSKESKILRIVKIFSTESDSNTAFGIQLRSFDRCTKYRAFTNTANGWTTK